MWASQIPWRLTKQLTCVTLDWWASLALQCPGLFWGKAQNSPECPTHSKPGRMPRTSASLCSGQADPTVMGSGGHRASLGGEGSKGAS